MVYGNQNTSYCDMKEVHGKRPAPYPGGGCLESFYKTTQLTEYKLQKLNKITLRSDGLEK